MLGNEKEPVHTKRSNVIHSVKFTPEIIVFLLSLVIGAFIRIYLAFTAPINMDENFYAMDAKLLSDGLTPFKDFPTRSPLMIMLGAGVLTAGGDFFTLRLMAVFFSVATGILVFLTARIMGGDRVASLAASLFLLSPYSIRYGYVYFTQPIEAFFVGLSFFLIIRWVKNHDSIQKNSSGVEANHIPKNDPSAVTSPSRSIWNSISPHRELIVSGIVLGLAAFIRRNALAFFPAGLLILAYYQITLRHRTERSWHRTVFHNPYPLVAFSFGFLIVFIPGILAFMTISGLSYTTYFFYSDYLQAHSSIVGNIEFILLYYDSRGYYFISLGMLFLTTLLLKVPHTIAEHFDLSAATRAKIDTSIKGILILGWFLASFALLGNNYDQHGNAWYNGLAFFFFFLLLSILTFDMIDPISNIIHRMEPIFFYLLALISGLIFILFDFENNFLVFAAIILHNIIASILLFKEQIHTKIRFIKRSETGFPSPVVSVGLFFISILMFYVLFRIILPYFYDLLFPLCILSAFLIFEVIGIESNKNHSLILASKCLFLSTLLLSVPIAIAEYHYRDVKANETDIDDFEATVEFLNGVTENGEIIFTAKAVIVLQADLENIFNIVRSYPYKANDTELIEDLEYPTIPELIDGLEEHMVRFIVVDWVMQTYYLDLYPELDEYVQENFISVRTHGSISIFQRI